MITIPHPQHIGAVISEPKTLILDVETSPILASVWELFDQNVGLEQIKVDWHLLSFAAKWLGSKDVIYADQSKAKDIEDDRALLKQLHGLLDQADIIVGHNCRRFDLKKINARLIVLGFAPPSPYKIIDTLEIAKRYFKFSSNKLAFLSQHLCKVKKLEHKKFPGFQLWKECLARNPEAWKEMKKYNVQDTFSTEELYNRLKGWHIIGPNIGLYNGEAFVCPKCGSDKIERRGYSYTGVGKYQRYQCKACAGWSRGATLLNSKEERQAMLR